MRPDPHATNPCNPPHAQVHFHLEVVAGAVHVLQQLTTEPVTVYLPEKVRGRVCAPAG